jgi:hypothetical protein
MCAALYRSKLPTRQAEMTRLFQFSHKQLDEIGASAPSPKALMFEAGHGHSNRTVLHETMAGGKTSKARRLAVRPVQAHLIDEAVISTSPPWMRTALSLDAPSIALSSRRPCPEALLKLSL